MKIKNILGIICASFLLVESLGIDALAANNAGDFNGSTIDGAVSTESSVTEEMCSADYWKAICTTDPNAVLMEGYQIALYNQLALASEEAKMYDIVNMDQEYNATALLDSLCEEIKGLATNKRIFVNTVEVNRDEYFEACAQLVSLTGYHGYLTPQYGVVVKRTDLNAWPTNAYIGYSASDYDDEATNSSLNVNEPFLIKQQCVINGQQYYFGYSNNCSGWVNAADVALCANKRDWLAAWQTTLDGKDFIVVTESSITLDKEAYLPYMNNVKLTLGTVLKLVPEESIPANIAERGTWHNYVVYIPTRDENGMLVQKMALISQRHSVSVGYLPLTQANLLDVAFACLGDRYGWGGSMEAFDCSLYTRTVYKCFGVEMPRNTTWQQKVPGTFVDATNVPDHVKTAYLSALPAGTLLYFPGHTMIYLGTVNGTCYCISALGSVSDSAGMVDIKSIYSVSITPLNVRRRNGSTWLTNLNGIVNPRGLL